MECKGEALCAEVIRISASDVGKCMRCGKCSASCPSYDEMEYHPHEFAYMVSSGDADALLESDSAYKCVSCLTCSERCPCGVAPSRLVEAFRIIKARERSNAAFAPERSVFDDGEIPGQALVSAFRKFSK